MELSYWQSKWRQGNIGFHMKGGYAGLKNNWHHLQLKENPVVFVPLCGKSKDLLFLSRHCSQVVGVEISEIAIQDFLKENELTARQTTFAGYTIYHADNIILWHGDFFKLPKHKLPPFDLIYDKAVLIALPPDMRQQYAVKILGLVSGRT